MDDNWEFQTQRALNKQNNIQNMKREGTHTLVFVGCSDNDLLKVNHRGNNGLFAIAARYHLAMLANFFLSSPLSFLLLLLLLSPPFFKPHRDCSVTTHVPVRVLPAACYEPAACAREHVPPRERVVSGARKEKEREARAASNVT